MSWSQLVQNSRKSKSRFAVAPSVLSADFSRLADEIRAVEEAGADFLHLDVMDGHFVPNITFGPFIVAAMRKLTDIPLDCHLMIENPDKYVDRFIDGGADIVTIHVEASTNVRRDLQMIRDAGRKCGITLNPNTPIDRVSPYFDQIDLFLIMSVFPGFGGQKFIADVLSKVETARAIREQRGLDFAIEIDGGINEETAVASREAGVDILVAGTAVFGGGNYRDAIRILRAEEGD